jgi:hypothetical protein
MQADSQDQVDYLMSKIRARYDEIEAEQKKLAVRALIWNAYLCLLFNVLKSHVAAAAFALESFRHVK